MFCRIYYKAKERILKYICTIGGCRPKDAYIIKIDQNKNTLFYYTLCKRKRVCFGCYHTYTYTLNRINNK